MRTFVVGDIHGSLKALKDVLNKSPFDKEKDEIIFLGDYVDGWGEEWELIEFLIQLQRDMKGRAIFLRGNHDIWLENYLLAGHQPESWLYNRGTSTVKSYKDKPTEGHLEFIQNLFDYYLDFDHNLYIHAGLNIKEDDLEKAATSFRLDGLKYCHWDRELMEICKHNHQIEYQSKNNLFIGDEKVMMSLLPKYNNVFLGHNITQNIHKKSIPFTYQNIHFIDTGAGWGSRLTIMDVDTKEFWQSEETKKLHKNGKRK